MQRIIRVGTSVILQKQLNNTIYVLLGKRKGSLGDGKWSFPGGHIEFGESVIGAAARELEEETGIIVYSLERAPYTEDLFADENKQYITMFLFTTVDDDTEAKLKEPDKCYEWVWFNEQTLPKRADLFEPVRNLMLKGYNFFSSEPMKSMLEGEDYLTWETGEVVR